VIAFILWSFLKQISETDHVEADHVEVDHVEADHI
jgi:hypothetical protein